MSETLKISSERSAEATGVSSLETFKFDPDEARRLIERDRPKNIENNQNDASVEKTASYLAVMPEKQEKELTPQDAANEYLSLLDELSRDFTNPDYKDDSGHFPHGSGDISRDLGKKYSDNPHYRWMGYGGTEAGGHDMTMWRIGSAEGLIKLEMQWREAGKKAEERQVEIDKKISDLDNAYNQKNKIAKFFGKRKYEKARKELISDKNSAGRFATQQTNHKMEEELSIVYNEKGGRYANIPYNKEKRESQNEKYSRQFFGLDDPERAAKIERAIELRQKYESEWSKKK